MTGGTKKLNLCNLIRSFSYYKKETIVHTRMLHELCEIHLALRSWQPTVLHSLCVFLLSFFYFSVILLTTILNNIYVQRFFFMSTSVKGCGKREPVELGGVCVCVLSQLATTISMQVVFVSPKIFLPSSSLPLLLLVLPPS